MTKILKVAAPQLAPLFLNKEKTIEKACKAILEAEEGILYAEIDLHQIIKAKRMFDVVGHYSRPDVFKFNVKKKPNQ